MSEGELLDNFKSEKTEAKHEVKWSKNKIEFKGFFAWMLYVYLGLNFLVGLLSVTVDVIMFILE
jgi:hypothetical protein